MAFEKSGVLVVKRRGMFGEIFGYGMGALVFISCFILTLLMFSFAVGEGGGFRPGFFMLLFGAGAVAMLTMFVRSAGGVAATFDPNTETLTVGGFFRRKKIIPFSEIARIAPIVNKSAFSEKQGFCIVPKSDPIFGARRFSSLFRKGSAKLTRFQAEVLPEIESMIGFVGNAAPAHAGGAEYDYTKAGYSKESGRYVKNNTKRLITSSILCLVFLLAGIKLLGFESEDPVIFGLIMAIASFAGFLYQIFIALKTVALDRNRGEIETSRGLLLGKRTSYPFERVKSFEVAMFYGNFLMKNRRSLSLRIEGLKKPVQLTGATGSRDKLEAEVDFLAGVMGKGLIASLNYVETRGG